MTMEQPLASTKKLLGLQIGKERKVVFQGRSVQTAIFKIPVRGPLSVGPLGLDGDSQADPSVHGGLSKALYAYPTEHYPFWEAAREQAGCAGLDSQLSFGSMGENLSLQGLLEAEVFLGDVLVFPRCRLRVTEPREPCFKFNIAMGFNHAVKKMAQSGFCGFYLAVEAPGTIAADEPFTMVPGPRRTSISDSFLAQMFKGVRSISGSGGPN